MQDACPARSLDFWDFWDGWLWRLNRALNVGTSDIPDISTAFYAPSTLVGRGARGTYNEPPE